MSVCLDRFAYGLRDPQEFEPEPLAQCEGCGEDLNQGDMAIELPGGGYCCTNVSCMASALGLDRKVLE